MRWAGLHSGTRSATRSVHAGFFTCGFHIAFLVTHLPGEVSLCGLPPAVASSSLALIGLGNIAGSLISGSSTAYFRSKHILATMYASRALLIGWYLMAPKMQWIFYVFAVGLGPTWLPIREARVAAQIPVAGDPFSLVAHSYGAAVALEAAVSAAFAELKIPVLFMTGTDSPAASRSVGRLLIGALPQVQVVEFHALGHMGRITRSEVVNRAISRFLERG